MQTLRPFGVQKFFVPPTGTMIGFIGRRDRDSFIFERAVVLSFVPLQNSTMLTFFLFGGGGGNWAGPALVPAANFSVIDPAASGSWST